MERICSEEPLSLLGNCLLFGVGVFRLVRSNLDEELSKDQHFDALQQGVRALFWDVLAFGQLLDIIRLFDPRTFHGFPPRAQGCQVKEK